VEPGKTQICDTKRRLCTPVTRKQITSTRHAQQRGCCNRQDGVSYGDVRLLNSVVFLDRGSARVAALFSTAFKSTPTLDYSSSTVNDAAHRHFIQLFRSHHFIQYKRRLSVLFSNKERVSIKRNMFARTHHDGRRELPTQPSLLEQKLRLRNHLRVCPKEPCRTVAEPSGSHIARQASVKIASTNAMHENTSGTSQQRWQSFQPFHAEKLYFQARGRRGFLTL